MTRKKPFSGKAKKQQLKEKRERNRQRADSDDEQAPEIHGSAATTEQLRSVRGDLRTVLKAESKAVIDARKRDATRLLEYATDRGQSQSIYTMCALDDLARQPQIFEKPRWSTEMTPEDLIAEEDAAYEAWISALEHEQTERKLALNLFERNIEVWRQLWRTIERSDVLVHLVDARCPLLHLSDRLVRYIRSAHASKRVMMVLTKADIVAPDRVTQWIDYINELYGEQVPVLAYNREHDQVANASLFAAIGKLARTINKDARALARLEDDDTLTVGFIGEPNVGKSSLLNSLFERKLVSVSATPGRTKHLQTHYFDRPELLGVGSAFKKVLVCDCPGVVFPRFGIPVALQILFGSFPIAQTREPYSAIRFAAENCDPHLHEIYKLTPVEEDDEEWTPYTLCEAYAKQRGFHIKGGKLDVNRAANQLLRDTLNGHKVVLSFPPPASRGSTSVAISD
ncbi:hypothetical protein PINS_up014156 [Pythium insidiosum]|nr:hypothetical protein PINS_up014156 [Pythium insidiosum]